MSSSALGDVKGSSQVREITNSDRPRRRERAVLMRRSARCGAGLRYADRNSARNVRLCTLPWNTPSNRTFTARGMLRECRELRRDGDPANCGNDSAGQTAPCNESVCPMLARRENSVERIGARLREEWRDLVAAPLPERIRVLIVQHERASSQRDRKCTTKSGYGDETEKPSG